MMMMMMIYIYKKYGRRQHFHSMFHMLTSKENIMFIAEHFIGLGLSTGARSTIILRECRRGPNELPGVSEQWPSV